MLWPVSFGENWYSKVYAGHSLNQMRNDTGSLTALINSGGLLFGSLSMLLCALPVWPGPVAAQALMAILVGLACLLGWLWLDSHKVYEG